MTTDTTEALTLQGVVKRYEGTTAVAGIDLRVGIGRRVALLGLNGAGKTTTISMILGLTRVDEGTIRVCGRAPRDAVSEGLVGAMLQSSRLPPRAKVSDVARLATRLYDNTPTARELMARTGLADLADRRVERLSGGEVQRVKFAVAAAGSPALLVLDEPTTAMDVPSRQASGDQMRRYVEAGRTVVYCTHLMEEAEDADEVIVMRAGRIVTHTTPAQMRATATVARVSIQGTVPASMDLPGATAVQRHGERTVVHTNEPDAVVYALAQACLVRQLRVESSDMSTAFLALAGDSPLADANPSDDPAQDMEHVGCA